MTREVAMTEKIFKKIIYFKFKCNKI